MVRIMGEIYTFTKYPAAYCHLCKKHYKFIWGHIRGKKHKRRFKEFRTGIKLSENCRMHLLTDFLKYS